MDRAVIAAGNASFKFVSLSLNLSSLILSPPKESLLTRLLALILFLFLLALLIAWIDQVLVG